jgi:putative ubiquitin-RnfH superfamily antitoxin RatB of RatAB toxin-antitoxin module
MPKVEVAYATAEHQWLMACDVPPGATVREALHLSGIAAQIQVLDVEQCPVGIFGKLVADAHERVVEAGDRLEIYRPLLLDPAEARRQRAAQAKAKR